MQFDIHLMYFARFTFKPDRAPEFLDGDQFVTEMPFDDPSEIVACVQEFEHALDSVIVRCALTGNVTNLLDFAVEGS